MASEIARSAPQRRANRHQQRDYNREEQTEKQDVANGPVEPVNPRKHANHLLWFARTEAGSDTRASKRSLLRRSHRRSSRPPANSAYTKETRQTTKSEEPESVR